MASITSISKPLIPINVKGSLGFQIHINEDLPLLALDSEVEARAFDVKFTDIVSMENNIGISAGISTNISNSPTKRASALNLETIAYYQPAIKFNVLKDLSLKVGTKLGVGGALTFRYGSCANTHKYYFSPGFVGTFVAGAEYKNIIMETELGPVFRLNVAKKATDSGMNNGCSGSSDNNDFLNSFPSLKIKAGYRF